MSLRLAAILSSALLLAGCSSSYLDVFNFSGRGSDDATREERAAMATPAAAPSPAPAGVQGAPDPFCASVARQDATVGDFDTATQQRMAQRNYQQCLAMFRTP